MTRLAASGILAVLAMSLGCQSQTGAEAWRGRVGERLALDGMICCKSADPATQDQCARSLLERIDSVENDLELLDAACRAGNNELKSRLLERLAVVASNAVIAGPDGAPVNGMPVLLSTDTARCELRWSLAGHAAPPTAEQLPAERWILEPGSKFSATVSGLLIEVRLSGSVETSNERVPISVALVAVWGDKRVALSLDKACAWNETTTTHLRVGLRPVADDPQLNAELSAYPAVLLVLPFQREGDGQATSVTDGAVPGTQLFPSYFGSIGPGAFDAANGPNCGDADGDGIPNLAERIRSFYARSIGNPGAGRKEQ